MVPSSGSIEQSTPNHCPSPLLVRAPSFTPQQLATSGEGQDAKLGQNLAISGAVENFSALRPREQLCKARTRAVLPAPPASVGGIQGFNPSWHRCPQEGRPRAGAPAPPPALTYIAGAGCGHLSGCHQHRLLRAQPRARRGPSPSSIPPPPSSTDSG